LPHDAKTLEKCLEKIPSRFELTTALARRWEALIQGAPPMVEVEDSKRMSTVFEEINDEKVALNTESRTVELKGEPIRAEEEEALFDEYLDAAVLEDRSEEE
jgi:DNA-directed RNA polymerase omega subunit